MKKITDRNLIREYLLGRLNQQAEVEDNVSESIFFDDEMAEVVDSVEDELIEEYLEGSLDPVDRDAVTNYFLQAPERQEKLRFAKLLASHLSHEPKLANVACHRVVRPWHSDFRTYGLMAVLALVIITALTYVNGARRTQARLESELAQQKERSSALAAEAELLQPSIIPLTLVADRSRGAENGIPEILVKAATRRIAVDVPLQSSSSSSYEVRLENQGGGVPLWSAKVSSLISSTGDARLVFDVPSSSIQSGAYSFVITPASQPNQSARYYDFRAKRSN
jgi:hypothetical protein